MPNGSPLLPEEKTPARPRNPSAPANRSPDDSGIAEAPTLKPTSLVVGPIVMCSDRRWGS